ncbi:MAG: translocation/assembly module TamB domain-containing protein [Bradymonadales bacterium]|nr:translocation/assembly module TamB domain-containing protein [Bradymonadales bacterium]
MIGKSELKRLSSPLKLGLLFLYPLILLVALYVSLFLLGNTHRVASFLTRLVSSVLPGTLEVDELQLTAGLTGARLYGVHFYHPQGQEQIHAHLVEASVSLLSLLSGEIDLPRVQLVDPRVLVSFGPKNSPHIAEVFTDLRSTLPDDLDEPPSSSGGGPTVRLRDIQLHNGEVLVHLPQISVVVHQLQVDNCRLDVVEGEFSMWADVRVGSGQVLMLPELFRLVDLKTTDRLRDYRLLRATDPWRSIGVPVPPAFPDEPGLLSIPFEDLAVDRFHWREDGFNIASVRGQVEGGELVAQGSLDVLRDKRETIHYGASGSLVLSPSSTALAYFTRNALYQAPTLSDGSPPAPGRFDFDIDGTLASIGGTLGLALDGLNIAGWALDHLSVQVETEPSEPLYLAGSGLQASAGEGRMAAFGFFDPRDGTYGLDLWLDRLDASWLLGPLETGGDLDLGLGQVRTEPASPTEGRPPPIRIAGDLDSKGFPSLLFARLQDDPDTPRNDLAAVEISTLQWLRDRASGQLPFFRASLAGRLRLQPDGMLLVGGPPASSDLLLSLDRDTVQVRGQIDLLAQTFDDLQIDGEIASLAAFLPIRGLDARVATAITLEGPFTAPFVQVDRLTLANLLAGGVSAGRVVSSFRTALGLGVGTLPRLEGGQIAVLDVSVGGLVIDSLESAYQFDGEHLWLRDTSINSGFGRIDLDGSVQLAQAGATLDDPRLDLSLRADSLDLAGLLPDLPVTGAIDLEARVAGSVGRPRIDGSFVLREAILFDEWIDRLSARLQYSRRGISLTDIELLIEEGRVDGALFLDPDGSLISAHFRSRGLQLEHFRHIDDLQLEISGSPEFNLQLIPARQIDRSLLPQDLLPAVGLPDIQGSLIVRELSIGGMDQGALALSIDTYGDTVTVVGQLRRDLDTRITFPFDRHQPIRLEATFDRLPLELAFPFLDTVIQRGEANGGRLEVETRLLDGFELIGDLSLSELWFQAGGRRFSTARPVHVTYSAISDPRDRDLHHALHIPELSFGTIGHYLTLQGDVRDWSDLDLRLRGEMELSLASLFTPAIAQANGVLGVTVDLGGSLSDPAVQGQIAIRDATITPRGLGDSITIRRGLIRVYPYWVEGVPAEHQMTLEIPRDQQIEGSLFSGAFSLNGQIHFDRFLPHDLELELFANNLSYRLPDLLSLSLNRVDLTLFSYDLADPDSFYLSGNVFIQEGLFSQELGSLASLFQSTFAQVFSREVARYREPIWRQAPLLEFMDFDIGIRARDNFRIRTSLFDADIDVELQIDLTLQGTLKDPVLVGEVKIIDGDITYQNRQFEVQSCSLRFDGLASPAGPLLPRIENCVAEATIERSTLTSRSTALIGEISTSYTSLQDERLQPYRIRVSAEGLSPADLNITLESVNVALDQRDILSLIFTGMTVDELTTSTDRGTSYDILFRQLIGLVQSELQEQFSIDEFTLIPSLAGATVIQLREQLSERLSLDVRTTVFGTEASTQAVTGQLILFDWLILELSERSDADNNVEMGGRVRLRVEFD